MYTYSFAFNKDNKIYETIYTRLRKDIINGNLKEGEKLPSKRILAKDLGISVHSVITAYNLLLEEGYIYSKPKSGYFVNKVPKEKDNNILYDNLNNNIKNIKYNFKTNQIDETLIPKIKIDKILKDILYSSNDYIKRSESKGDLSLRIEIAKYLYETKDINVIPNQIVISSSSEDLMNKIVKLLDIKEIAIENPGYHNLIKSLDVSVDYINLDSEGIKIDELKNTNANLVIVTPYAQFPTGIKMSLKRKEELIKEIENKDIYVCEDSFDSNLRAYTYPSTSLFSISENVIYTESFSRSLYPGLCISFMVLPLKLIDKFDGLFSNSRSNVNTLNQLLLKELLKTNSFERHLNRLKVINKKKKEKILSLLNKDLFEVLPTNNYISILAKIKKDIDIDKLKKEFIKNGIEIDFLNEFFNLKNKNKNILMIGYSALSLDLIDTAYTNLEKSIINSLL